MRILHEAVRQRRDVHEAVLVHADVDEGAEVGHVRHHAFQRHAGAQVFQLVHAFLEGCRAELGTGVAARLFQLLQDVLDGGQAELLVGVAGRVQAGDDAALAHHIADAEFQVIQHLLHHGIGLGVDGRSIQRVVAALDAQEARRLLEGFGPQTRHVQKCLAVGEGAVLVTMTDDVLGQRRPQTRNAGEQRHAGRVQVHAHAVDAILHHAVQRLGQASLAHVVLVLAHTDGLGLDLDQFGQRILQATGDGDRAPQAHVQCREFLRCQLRGRIHRGAGLGDHGLGQVQLWLGAHQVGHQLVGLARGGAVADGHQLDLVGRAQSGQRGQRTGPVVARLVRVDGGRLQQLAGVVHDRHLHASAHARVQPHRDPPSGRCCQQQILHVQTEDADGFFLGFLAQDVDQFALDLPAQLDLPGPAHRLQQPRIGRALLVGNTHPGGDGALAPARAFHTVHLVGQFQRQRQHFFAASAQQRQCTVRGNLGKWFLVIEIIGKLGTAFRFVGGHLGNEHGLFLQVLAQAAHQVGIFGKALHQDLPRTVQGCLGIGHARIVAIGRGEGGFQIGGCLGLGHQHGVGQQGIGQRFQSGFAGNLCLGATLGLVGGVQILQSLLAVGLVDACGQLGRELALFGDRVQDGLAAGVQLAQIDQAFGQVAKLRVVQVAGDFLAVAGNERHGGPFVQQGDGGLHLLRPDRQFGGETLFQRLRHGLGQMEREG